MATVIEQDEDGTMTMSTIDVNALSVQEHAQFDVQIATAKRYPRDIAKAQKEAIALATQDEDTAASMHYLLKRKDKDGSEVYIEGPSVRAAEIIVYAWGNIRAEARVVDIGDAFVTAQGTCMDLEKNVGCRMEVKRRITTAKGKRYGEDMIVVTGNAACGIAFRNAVFKVIPAVLAKRFLDAAKKKAMGGAMPLEQRVQRALKWFGMLGVGAERVLAYFNIENVGQIDEEKVAQLNGLKTAIQENSTTVEEAFPRPEAGDRTQSAGAAKMNEDDEQPVQSPPAPEPPPAPAKHYLAEPEKKFLSSHTKLVTLLESDFDHVPEAARVTWMQNLTKGKASTADFTLADFHICIDAIEGGRGPKAE